MLARVIVLLSLVTTEALAQGKGGLAGGLRIDGPEENFRSATIIVRAAGLSLPASRRLFGEDSYLIQGIPEGLAEICVRSEGYRTIFDTVTIKKKSVARREFVLEPVPPRTDPYPDCDRSLPVVYAGVPGTVTQPMSGQEAFPVWEGLLRHYRRSIRMSEGDFVRLTFRVTGSSADTVGPAVVVLALDRNVPPTPALLEWFATLAPRGLVEATCEEIDVAHCPQETVTTYLKLAEPQRVHGDTVDVTVTELGLNPASCRTKKGGFVGTWIRGFVVVERDGRWEVIGRSPERVMTASGFCKPEEEAE